MTRSKITLALAIAVAEAVVAVLIVLASNHDTGKILGAALAVTAGLSFVVSGLIALQRRPENRTGFYLAAVGYLWFFGALGDANNDAIFTFGVFLSNLAFIPFAALILAFPDGQLDRLSRRLVRFTVWFILIGPPLILLFDETPSSGCSRDCPHSAILVYRSSTLATTAELAATAVTVGLIGVVVVLLVRRWRDATVAARRALLPVYAAGAAALVALLLSNLLSAFTHHADDVLGPVFLVLFTAVPLAFLLGILRSRLARGSVAALMVSLEHGEPLRSAIAEALGDPSLRLAFWLEREERYVDRDGRLLDVGAFAAGSVTLVEREGRCVGALLHDPSLAGERELVESVAAAVAFALDNERLQAELRAQNEFLITIVDTAPCLLVNVGLDGRIRRLNPAALATSGYEPEDEERVRGRLFWDVFIDPEERPAMEARFHAAAPEHAAAEYENTFTNAGGERLRIIWRGAPVPGESGVVESVIAAGLDVTAHRLQEEEIRASRGRIVAAADDARRRLERDLHDGAQQRLVSLSLALRLAQAKVGTDPPATARILAGASEELTLALEELRELARGIHPAVLTDRGLDAALESLATRAPVPLELTALGKRLPPPIEAAAYYVVSEAIANVVKHAQASSVRVGLNAANGAVVIEVADDGVGGADAARGSGLRGLADRLAALDGRLRIESPPSGGTLVVAEIPLPRGAATE